VNTPAQIASQSLWDNNPALVQMLGLCPLLAISTNVVNALGLGIATLLALTVSSTFVSLLRPITRPDIRLPLFVLVIAAAVSGIELVIRAWLPDLHAAIGLFIPLIVTNCLILGRAEAFATRHRIDLAAFDGFMMGLGFLAALVAIGGVRELIGHGTLFADMQLLFGDIGPALRLDILPTQRGLLLAILPTGAFFVYAALIAARNAIKARASSTPPTVS
jgi:electron transport complex protein RnfE